MPPPAEGFAVRLVLGPALRTQPDRRLVSLVREGYEAAFEEIVRRYGKPLTRYAGAIVGSRGEDVTQDAFSKALLALRRTDAEIELRPWLFRIVRNTALNDLRDRPPAPEALAEAIAGGATPAEELERREELADLMHRLRSLPEPQRAAIVMRELEGLSHEEIAAALGLSGGAARQAIYRARKALRDGLGVLLPLPILRLLIDHGGEVAVAGAGAGGAAAAGGALGGAGAGMALKAGVVTAVLAGSVSTGIALRDGGQGQSDAAASAANTPSRAVDGAQATRPATSSPASREVAALGLSTGRAEDDSRNDGSGHEGGGPGEEGSGHGGEPDDGTGRGHGGPPDGHARQDSGDDGHRGPGGPRPGGRGEGHGGEGGTHSGPGHSGGGRQSGGGGHDGAGHDGPGPDGDGSGRHGSGGEENGFYAPPPPRPPQGDSGGETEGGTGPESSGSAGSGWDDPGSGRAVEESL